MIQKALYSLFSITVLLICSCRENSNRAVSPVFPKVFEGISPLSKQYHSLHDGIDDIRDILITKDAYWAATGQGVIKYGHRNGMLEMDVVYTIDDGLPSNSCHLLKSDATGGVWVACQVGIGYLPRNGTEWQRFTSKNGLPSNDIRDLAISASGKRVWVSTAAGLATANTTARNWQTYAKKNLLDLFIHPTKEVVWCKRVIPYNCSCDGSAGTGEMKRCRGHAKAVNSNGERDKVPGDFSVDQC